MSGPDRLRVLIPDGDSPFALQVAQSLRRGDRRIRVDAAYVDHRSLSRFSRFIHRSHRLDRNDLIGSIRAVIDSCGADVLLPVSGPGIAFVAQYAHMLEDLVRLVPTPSPAAIGSVNDKWMFAQRLQAAGIPAPATALFDRPERLDEFDRDLPVLLKPRCGSGGLGIVLFDRPAEVLPQADRFIGEGDPYILQQYISGHDIDRSVLCSSGRVIAGTVQEGVSVRKDFAPSGSLHFHCDRKVEELVDRTIAELGWSGIAHLDLRYGADGSLNVIELNPRYWSTMLGSLCAGVNFPLIAVRAALGLQQDAIGMRECYYVSLKEWPHFQRRLGVPLKHTSLYHGVSDPLAKLLKKYRPSTAFGGNVA